MTPIVQVPRVLSVEKHDAILFNTENGKSFTVATGTQTMRNRDEFLTFQISQFVSDIGGTLGLYVGASVISLCEVLDLLLTLCAGKLCPRKNENYQGQQGHRNYTPENDTHLTEIPRSEYTQHSNGPFAETWPSFNHTPMVNREGPFSYQFRGNIIQ